jgi:hypothetical protein
LAVYNVSLRHPGALFPSIALPPPPVVTAEPVNLEVVQTLPDERLIVLLTIVTYLELWTCSLFRERVHFILEGLKADLALIAINVDETGCPDFVDPRNESVIVPATSEGHEIAMPVDRSIKRAPLIGGIVQVCVIPAQDAAARIGRWVPERHKEGRPWK